MIQGKIWLEIKKRKRKENTSKCLQTWRNMNQKEKDQWIEKGSSSKQKWGILKYLPAEISSEMMEISSLKDEKKEIKTGQKWGMTI